MSRPARRRVLAAGAGAAAALLGVPAASAAPRPGADPADPAAPLQPYAAYWFPDTLPAGTPPDGVVWRSLAAWTPETDRDLPFNTATVPLAARFTPVPANRSARAGQARISALVSFGPTAGLPSQGEATADRYAPTHWAYLDELVFWGGSSAEGLILAPAAPVVDAAHRNGVPVLGTVFLPPAAYGGQLRWTRDLVREDGAGRFPLAAKLVAVARAYGFDGWFVNAETDGGDPALAARMRGFLRALRSGARRHGLRVTWYDAMDRDGRVAWQGALNDRNEEFFQDAAGPVADTVFLDFRWTARTLADSGRRAARLGRDRYALWAGVDVEAAGRDTAVDWDAIAPPGRDHVVSYGFYRPEWTLHHLPAGRTPGQFHAEDDRFWTGGAEAGPDRAADPVRAAAGGGGWRPPAALVADRSTVTALPFATAFNTGHGLRWYERGAVTSGTPWYHLGLQDRLPPRRWPVRTRSPRPDIALDFADAWYGGSSLLVRGPLPFPAVLDLFPVRLPCPPGTVLELVHRADPGSGPVAVEAAVALRDAPAPGAPVPYAYLPAGTVRAGGWRTVSLRLDGLGPGTVRALGVRLTGRGGRPVAWRLGALAVRGATGTPAAPTGLAVTGAATGGGATALRLVWRPAPGPVRHYALHRRLPGGARHFLGGTCGTAFFAAGLRRAGREAAAVLEVRAVDELFAASAPATVRRPW
ncbi:endo-beta-N-acetylglucosaminidase [Streptomyces sp. NRRL F-4489]|uniref:endo-beta-N-acetylglucosaminidase n=1 Tax=Streptomyces sp. NRRL F-4489 TaxID=1609095 RepID=UPI000747ACA2|nr:endo-beta-N-acetylglucosaminidase [Streptomyces sp. NRRL F-4489]KUL38028.1 endo-beta-N-acetylglucosaminidase [Streptomyces sp. NRRL F-4489]